MVNSGRRRNGSQLTKTAAKYEAKSLNVVCVLSRGHVVNEEYSVKLLGFIVDQKLSLGGSCPGCRQEVVYREVLNYGIIHGAMLLEAKTC